MAVTKKDVMGASVFSGISSVYAVYGGFTTVAGSTDDEKMCDLSTANVIELPVSDDSGFSFTGGEPTINHFKVKGLNADWASTFTPGDGTLTLEIPTYHTQVLELVYGQKAKDLKVKLPSGIGLKDSTGTPDLTVSGKAFSFNQTAVVLGLLVINETGDKALFIKQAKFTATPSFDGSDKPYCVTLNGTIAAASDVDSMAILAPDSTYNA